MGLLKNLSRARFRLRFSRYDVTREDSLEPQSYKRGRKMIPDISDQRSDVSKKKEETRVGERQDTAKRAQPKGGRC